MGQFDRILAYNLSAMTTADPGLSEKGQLNALSVAA